MKPETDISFQCWRLAFPYWNPHGMALWSVLNEEGYVRHRQHLEALSIIVGRES